jgi:hypothetical protein
MEQWHENKSCLSCDNFKISNKSICREHRSRSELKARPNYQPFRNRGDLLRLGSLSKKRKIKSKEL